MVLVAKTFSIVLPTYSGLKTLPQTLESMLSQNPKQLTELIVVIDGPAPKIKSLIEHYRSSFSKQKINLKVIQFKTNKGRIEARIAGAKKANSEQLLFLEDRVYLADGYFKTLLTFNEQRMLSNVLEAKTAANPISDGLTAIRKLVYGKSWGQDFKDYLITSDNFEKSPKGLASLWVPRDEFLRACQKFAGNRQETRDMSDDTGILRILVDDFGPIKRTSQLKIYYQPRTGMAESFRHLYERGPRFVDYYIRPGTKFFPVLAGIYTGLLVLIFLLILRPILVVWALIILALVFAGAGAFIGSSKMEKARIAIGLPMIMSIFVAGVLKGTFKLIGKAK